MSASRHGLLLQDFLVQSRLHGSSVSASPGPEAAKQLQTSRPTTIMFDLWHNVFFYENILHQMEWDSSLPNISAFVLSVHRIFSQRLAKGFVFGKTLWCVCFLCFLCLFFCCSELLCDFLDELYICSWSHFGRPASPGKVHHRSRLSPFVHNTHTVVFWSLRNGSRLISANDLVSQLFLIVASWPLFVIF